MYDKFGLVCLTGIAYRRASRMKQGRKKGADVLVEAISKELSDGKLKAGDKLPTEAELCQRFGASRTLVREALHKLKAIGVIETTRGSGSYITEGSLDAMKSSLEFYSVMSGDPSSWLELLDLRVLIEADCARGLASDKFAEPTLKRIKKQLDAMKAASDAKAIALADIAFHEIIIEAAGNKLFVAVLDSLKSLQLRFSTETYSDDPDGNLLEKIYSEHRAIYEAIENRDGEAAEQAMKEHLAATRQNLLRYIARHEELKEKN